MIIAKWAALILGAGALLLILDRLMLAAERRGWVYYRKRKAAPGAVGNALLELQSMLEPAHKHVIEERQSEKSSQDQQGDPPDPGGG
ncbi:MAG: hypothetical protein P9M14_00695 [Candidatus Alcyoniella australis]|nr:hypothetical protein [Candidatus Alcyoniella australis]